MHQTLEPNGGALQLQGTMDPVGNLAGLGLAGDIVSERPPSMHDNGNNHTSQHLSSSPLKKLTLKRLSMTPKPDKLLNKGWQLQTTKISKDKERTIKE